MYKYYHCISNAIYVATLGNIKWEKYNNKYYYWKKKWI
jgi:hypothetical protein